MVDTEPGPSQRLVAPGRSPSLAITPSRQVKVPPVAGMADPAQRVRIFHALANHELQAVELFAWALLAFSDAPKAFRRGLLATLIDEQRHCQLYIEHIDHLGSGFGDYPVTGHFWNKLEAITSPLEFICAMGLTFENANLDFAHEYAEAALAAADHRGAAILREVHRDEIGHVKFAWRWLTKLKGEQHTEWQAYLSNVTWPLGPARARGRSFDREARQQAGLSEEFIQHLEDTSGKRPGGEPR